LHYVDDNGVSDGTESIELIHSDTVLGSGLNLAHIIFDLMPDETLSGGRKTLVLWERSYAVTATDWGLTDLEDGAGADIEIRPVLVDFDPAAITWTEAYVSAAGPVEFEDGFDSGDFSAWDAHGGTVMVVGTGYKHDGTHGALAQQSGWCYHNLDGSYSHLRMQWWDSALYCDGGVDPGSQYRVARFYNTSGAIAAEVFWDVTSGEGYDTYGKYGIRVWDNNGDMDSALSSMTPIKGSNWQHLKFDLKAAAGTGYCKLYMNDTLIVEKTGLTNDQRTVNRVYAMTDRISGNKNHWHKWDTFAVITDPVRLGDGDAIKGLFDSTEQGDEGRLGEAATVKAASDADCRIVFSCDDPGAPFAGGGATMEMYTELPDLMAIKLYGTSLASWNGGGAIYGFEVRIKEGTKDSMTWQAASLDWDESACYGLTCIV